MISYPYMEMATIYQFSKVRTKASTMLSRKVFSTIYLSLAVVFFISCGDDDGFDDQPPNQVTSENTSPISGQTINYLALGDSYTIGQGVDEEDRWPNQLARNLELGLDINVEVEIIAQSGWNTSALLSAIASRNPSEQDLVSLLIGVNNQYQKIEFAVFEQEFEELMKIGIDLSGENGHFFVVSIPDYGVTPFGSNARQEIADELDRYNYHIKERCQTEGIPFIDVTAISRELGDSPGALAADRLHPSAAQYRAWVENIYPVVLSFLNE